KKMTRMGYYLALLHRFSNKVAQTLGYEEAIYEVPVTPPEPVAPKPTPAVTITELTPPPVTPTPITPAPVTPTPVTPEEIPAPITFEEIPAPVSTDSIPAPLSISEAEESFDKRALFDALQKIEVKETPAQPALSSVEIDSEALKSALSPKPVAPQPTPPIAPQPAKPFTAAEASDDELFKISDKEAVLEALKVLGWEEPEEER
ncbi:MAG: hypothetical protein ACFFDN_32465, partial [Candidatus Hodarchaeota archaeon]